MFISTYMMNRLNSGKLIRQLLRPNSLSSFIIHIHILLLSIVMMDRFLDFWFTNLLRLGFVTIYLSFIPGGLVLALIISRKPRLLNWLIYSVGLSLIMTMILGVALSLVSPVFQVERPFNIFLLLTVWTLLAGLLVLFIKGLRGNCLGHPLDEMGLDVRKLIMGVSRNHLIIFCLPAASALSVFTLNMYGNNIPLLSVLILLAALPLILIVFNSTHTTYAVAVYSLALSLLYHRTLWSSAYPMEIWMPVITVDLGAWSSTIGSGIGHEGLLANSVVYPIFSIFSGITPITQLETVNPLIMALLPLAAFALYRQFFDPSEAFVSATVLTFSHQFFFKTWPYGARDGISTLFMIFFFLTVFDKNLTKRSRNILSGVFLAAVVFTHYGVSYILLAVIIFTVAGTVVLQFQNRYDRFPNVDGSEIKIWHLGVLSALVYGWNRATAGGAKSGLIESKLSNLLSGELFSGTSAKSIQYASPPSTSASKLIYISLISLAGLGLLISIHSRYKGEESILSDQYLLACGGFLTVLAFSFLPVGESFGAGRLIMISFPLLAPMILICIRYIINRSATVINDMLYKRTDSLSISYTPQMVMALCLAIFLIINAGVVATVVPNDYAPNNIVNDPVLSSSENPNVRWRSSGCVECDAYSVTWMVDHRSPDIPAYSDAVQKSVRYYGFTVASRADSPYENAFSENSSLKRSNERNVYYLHNDTAEQGYIRIHSANTKTGMIKPNRWSRKLVGLNTVSDSMDSSNKIYSSEHSVVYLAIRNTNSSISSGLNSTTDQ